MLPFYKVGVTIHDHKATKHTENIANMRFLVVFLPTYIFLLFVRLISRKEEEWLFWYLSKYARNKI